MCINGGQWIVQDPMKIICVVQQLHNNCAVQNTFRTTSSSNSTTVRSKSVPGSHQVLKTRVPQSQESVTHHKTASRQNSLIPQKVSTNSRQNESQLINKKIRTDNVNQICDYMLCGNISGLCYC